MKRLGLLLGVLLCPVIFASKCPDFTGTYVNKENGKTTYLALKSFGCAGIQIGFAAEKEGPYLELLFDLDGEPSENYRNEKIRRFQTAGWNQGTVAIETDTTELATGKTTKSYLGLTLAGSHNLIYKTVETADSGAPVQETRTFLKISK